MFNTFLSSLFLGTQIDHPVPLHGSNLKIISKVKGWLCEVEKVMVRQTVEKINWGEKTSRQPCQSGPDSIAESLSLEMWLAKITNMIGNDKKDWQRWEIWLTNMRNTTDHQSKRVPTWQIIKIRTVSATNLDQTNKTFLGQNSWKKTLSYFDKCI